MEYVKKALKKRDKWHTKTNQTLKIVNKTPKIFLNQND